MMEQESLTAGDSDPAVEQDRYGSLSAWSRELGIIRETLAKRLRGAPSVQGRVSEGFIVPFYCESVVLQHCGELLNIMARSVQDGFFHEAEEPGGPELTFGTIPAWAERLGISPSSVTHRLRKREGIRIRYAQYGTTTHAFYAEPDVREMCADLLEEMPRADKDGFFVHGGERYGHPMAWEKIFPTTGATIRTLLRGIKPTRAKHADGRVEETFYSESAVRVALGHRTRELPKANEQGFFEVTAEDRLERYGYVRAWANELGVHINTVKERVTGLPTREGRDSINHTRQFYAESDIRRVCADLLADLPEADEQGFIRLDGERFAVPNTWASELGVSLKILLQRLQGQTGIDGKDRRKHIKRGCFFPESLIRKLSNASAETNGTSGK